MRSIEYVRTDIFFDLRVPGPANYLAEGLIHHNTGKTRQELAVAQTAALAGKKVLIVSPSEVLKPNWKKHEVSGSFANDSKAMGLQLHLDSGGEQLKAGEIHLTTYDKLAKMVEAKAVDANTVLVFDESHSLKNWSSARAKNGYELASAAGQVLYATATPADKPMHIGHLFRAQVFGQRKWADTWHELGMIQKTIHTSHGDVTAWDVSPRVGYKEVYRRMSGLFDRMIQDGLMLKRDISLKGLKVEADHLTFPPDVHKALAKVFDDKMASTKDNVAAALMAQRFAQEQYKIPHVVKAVKEELAAGRSVIVFAARVNDKEDEDTGEVVDHATMAKLREALEAQGVSGKEITELHGAATKTPAQKAKAMADFQSGKAKVILATVESGGTGINLDDTTGKHPRTTIVMTPPFSAVQNVQLAGRTWRLNTKGEAKIRHVFSDSSVDAWNAAIIARKMKVHGAVVAGESGKLDASKLDEQHEGELDIGHGDNPYKWPALVVAGQAAPAPPTPGTPSYKFVQTSQGPRYVHSAEASQEFWSHWKTKKDELKSKHGVSVSKNPKTGDWGVSVWGKSNDEVHKHVTDLKKMGVLQWEPVADDEGPDAAA